MTRSWLWLFFAGIGFWWSPVHADTSDTDSLNSDSGYSSLDDDSGSFSTTFGNWEFFLYGGTTRVDKFHSTMITNPISETITIGNRILTLNFSESELAVDKLDKGVSLGVGMHRNLASWISVGVEGGASFSHEENVERGEILYISGSTMEMIPYQIDYSAYFLQIEPTIKVGPWLPLGRFALKPYATLGAGWHHVEESALFLAAGQEFQLGHRSDSAMGVTYGAGLDLKISGSGSVSALYQAQKFEGDGGDIELSSWLLRFSYHF